jgi:predicted tellurium resistance membrane protein TerC
MDWLIEPQVWAGLLTLTALEIVLGIDNLVFIAVLVARVQAAHRTMARRLGLGLALGMRLVLLSGISWIAHLTYPVLVVAGHEFSWRKLILIGGGLFLVYKGTVEIHAQVESDPLAAPTAVRHSALAVIVTQIALLDIVFSLDSVITAVGMVGQLPVMIAAVVIAMGVMMVASGPTAGFIDRHPTVKMLVFSFLLLVGMALMADGFGVHVPKDYIYTAIAFSAGVEFLNQFADRRQRMRGTGCRPDSSLPSGLR